MSLCPSCGYENQPDAKFCSQCATALTAVAPPSREERKVVTVLFADLVGFTSRAERMDPEDVRAFLSPYYSRLRTELERYGGTVEKFIGDAVMALFGAPVAHEDDPERAVRAALAIRDWVQEEERLQVRIGVNTGEALISLDARPSSGEGMAAGDVINTAARLQTAAPVNGVLVGMTTYRATRHVIDYAELPAVEVKGKDEPVPVWQALQARSRLGVDVPHEAKTELIGRERELDIVRQALGRMRAERSTQLLTIIGVPGIGKSRLLYELSRIVDADPELFTWRQGRSLPYGEGVSFWALAEMVKAQAGILESDSVDDAQLKLRQTVAEVVPDEDRDWVTRHLQTLLGIETSEAAGDTDRRAESFAAWRRFFESVAEQRPLVAVFEDLHWADDGLLDFVDHLVDRAGDVPLLVVGSARPELLERRPGWGGGKPNAVTISLSPLSDDDTARLVKSLLDDPALIDSTAQVIANAGGNPLYAEQFVQMVSEQGSLAELPGSIQGIVGARLDALVPTEKQLLQNAAVIGKVFWPGAVAALDDGDAFATEETLHGLEKKQFVRRDRRSSVAGQSQFAFQHVLLRDVAYQQIPRAERIRKHVRTAAWIESLGRPEDQAEMLAHHYASALELANTVGEDLGEVAPRARAALEDAGDRAAALYAFASAASFYRQAVALWPDSARHERAKLLLRLAIARTNTGEQDAQRALEQARDELLAVGDRVLAAVAQGRLGDVWWLHGDRDSAEAHIVASYELVRDTPPSPEKVEAMWRLLRVRTLAGNFDPAVAAEALEMAEQLGLDGRKSELLVTIGTGRELSGDPAGREQVIEGIELALAKNYLWSAQRGTTNLSAFVAADGDLRASFPIAEESHRIAQRIGSKTSLRWTTGNKIAELAELGRWQEAADEADAFLAESEVSGGHYLDAAVRQTRAFMRLARDDADAATDDMRACLTAARLARDPQVLRSAVAIAMHLFAELSDTEASRTLFEELLALSPDKAGPSLTYTVVDVLCTAELLKSSEVLQPWVAAIPLTRWSQAAQAFLNGDVEEATSVLEATGSMRGTALVRLHGSRRLIAAGRSADAAEELAKALDFFRSVSATRYIRIAEELLRR